MTEPRYIEEWSEELYGLPCISCGHPLLGPLESYVHDGGVQVLGSDVKLWLYKTCADCGYENSWWKLLRRREVLGSDEPKRGGS